MATQTTNAASHIETKIPATMRAVVYRGINDMRVETVPVPAIGPGELLVKVATCGICGTDLKKIHTGSHSAPTHLRPRNVRNHRRCRRGRNALSRRRARGGPPPRALRRVLLLPQRNPGTVPALQKGRRYRRIRAVRRRLCGVHPRDGLGCRQLRRRADSRRMCRSSRPPSSSRSTPCSRA